MSIRLSEGEAWEVLRTARTGIFTTLRRDGFPVSLPVWFVVEDRTILVAGPAVTKKFARVRHDDRVSFLVESGERWRELRAVHVVGRAEIVGDPDWAHVDELLEALAHRESQRVPCLGPVDRDGQDPVVDLGTETVGGHERVSNRALSHVSSRPSGVIRTNARCES